MGGESNGGRWDCKPFFRSFLARDLRRGGNGTQAFQPVVRLCRWRGGIGRAFVPPPPGIAVTFRFEVVDLAGTTPGQDLWEYSYQVTGPTLTAG